MMLIGLIPGLANFVEASRGNVRLSHSMVFQKDLHDLRATYFVKLAHPSDTQNAFYFF